VVTKNIGILTGGGDCAGLNSAIKWVVNTAMDNRLEKETGVKYQVIGIRDGWSGLVMPLSGENDANYLMQLDENVVRAWDRYGGTNLGSSRTNPYEQGNNRSKLVVDNIKRLKLSALVAIGGNDTLEVAARLTREGIKIIGIPKTIDKDVWETDYTLGYETALNVITSEVDRLRTYAGSHRHIVVVETMGRNSGWLALEGGESSGASIILIPEYDFSIDKVSELLLESKNAGNRYNIVVVAEGAKPIGGKLVTRSKIVDSFSNEMLGGIGDYLTQEIESRTGLETRSVVLSYLQRGGTPCAYDRRMGRYFGIAAVDLLVKEDFNKMVSLNHGNITGIPLIDVLGKTRKIDINTQYDIDRYNGRRHIVND